MAKLRRKLSPEMEKEITTIFKKVELITALIFDIEDESLQGEFIEGFEPAKMKALHLKSEYDLQGYNEVTIQLLQEYKILMNRFQEDYEV